MEKFKSASGISVKEVYTSLDLEEKGFEYAKDLCLPGEYPYTRGISPAMYREYLWIISQYAGFGSAEDTNKRYKYLLDQGQTGLSIALDLPTQMGYDSDHPLAKGEVGRVGVAIDTLKDMEILFNGIPLNKPRQIVTTANAIGPIMLAMFLALAENQNIPLDGIVVRLQNDVLKEYIARGTYIFPPKVGIRLSTDVIQYCSKNIPHWLPITFCGYHMREAGANAIQEIAFTFANAIAYIKDTLSKGLKVDDFAPKLSIFFSVNMDFFEEIAKFRAARKIWANMMKKRFGACDPKSWVYNLITYTAGSTLTAQQPMNNIIRVALEALAAVLGGTQYLYTSSLDEALSLPSEEAQGIALMTQHVIAHESGVTNTVDPLGGSYFLETLTSHIEDAVEEYLKKIDAVGGAVAAIERGFFQKKIAEEAYKCQEELEKGNRIMVGVNKHRVAEEASIGKFEVDQEAETRQTAKLNRVKEERDKKKIEFALEQVKDTAERGENLIPSILEAIKSYATIGEICDALRVVFGTYREVF